MHELECHCWRANDRNARLQEGVAEFFANARPELEGWKDALLSRDDLFASSAITVGMGSVHAQLMLVSKGMDGPDGVSKARPVSLRRSPSHTTARARCTPILELALVMFLSLRPGWVGPSLSSIPTPRDAFRRSA